MPIGVPFFVIELFVHTVVNGFNELLLYIAYQERRRDRARRCLSSPIYYGKVLNPALEYQGKIRFTSVHPPFFLISSFE